MQIKRLSPAGCEELYRTALPRDFPAAECKPFAEVRRLLEAGLYEPLLLTDDAGARLAYAWQVVLPGQRTALLDYFAVRCDLRGSGVGTAALQLLRDYYALRVQDLLLECEHPAEAPDPAVARRRIGFYLRAGARATGLESRVFGERYSILQMPVFGSRYAVLSLPCGGTAPDAVLCKELRALYKVMVPEPYCRGRVIFYGG